MRNTLQNEYNQLKSCQSPGASFESSDNVYLKIINELLDCAGSERKDRILRQLTGDLVEMPQTSLRKREKKVTWKKERSEMRKIRQEAGAEESGGESGSSVGS